MAHSSLNKPNSSARGEADRLAALRELEAEEERNGREPFELSDDDLLSFAAMWYEEFDEILTTEAARYEATRLLEFFVTLSNALVHSRLSATLNHGRMAQ